MFPTVLFADESVAAKIMASDDPREQKALGRKVSNFSDETWKKNCRKIVKKGNLAKVTSNHGKRLSKAQCKPPLKNPAISSGYILSTFLSHLLYIYMCMLLDVQFSQNSDLRAELLQTKGTTPVETGPRDTMWGIGLSAKSWKAQNRKYWRGIILATAFFVNNVYLYILLGKNLLGEILTEVRDELATGNDTND